MVPGPWEHGRIWAEPCQAHACISDRARLTRRDVREEAGLLEEGRGGERGPD